MDSTKYKLLSQILRPSDLRRLKLEQLNDVCEELRKYIIEVISQHPGHIGSSLGAVELAVAIHYVFDTPYDNVIWDVGHQAYAHKILTERRDKFTTIRQFGGISGFPKMSESEYDSFGAGHASTSVSAALGMALSAQFKGEFTRQTIAVVGDGAATGGMIYEALNNAGATKANMIIILNDNGIAIDKNTGAMKDYLMSLSLSKKYNNFRDRIWNDLVNRNERLHIEKNHFVIQQLKRGMKASILGKNNLFEDLGVRYFGTANGNDVLQIIDILQQIKEIKGPKILHCITVKGRGLAAAEQDQTKFHAPGVFNPETGETIKEPALCPPKFQDVFGETIVRLAKENEDIVGISPAMLSGSSLDKMMEVMPDRCFDVGIAEEHAVTFAAGLAARKMRPYLAIYSTFLQRGYDQVIHDVALQKLPVVFCIDRAGLVGEDGPTHHGAFDLAYLRSIPNMIISAAMDEFQLQNLMFTAQYTTLPMSIRYPRGKGSNIKWRLDKLSQIAIGRGRKLVEGKDVAIITIGKPGNFVSKALEILKERNIDVHPSHYDMIFLKPIDVDLLEDACTKHKYIITVEDGTIIGGLGSAVLEFIHDRGYDCKVKRLGIPDDFIEQGKPAELYHLCGFDAEGIANAVISVK